ncbi:uncharacterized protein J4E88_010030 [Alternaria novae-zelandiae]|uniref:uncharacterized protein n=1 Tax=Alternaria novae-zelandiae TaxID=430562 RepID=UPI0020C1D360|nr:uncharacterized protein J4E88_010030 [Alternaria novae-zelandiae]KAI4667780.1 hypothetical protein J4E88_010030 [Alternaria novae-zelandiae]
MSTLRLATASNVRAFRILTDALATSQGKWAQWIDDDALNDEIGRFRVWAGNLGALQKGHSSLDYRLRDSPNLSSSALKLLNELEHNLSETHAVVSEARLPYEAQPPPDEPEDEESDDDFFVEEEDEDESDSDEERIELKMRLEEIIDIIDNLYKLSVRIRTPSVRLRSLKASSYTLKDLETGVDVLEEYANQDKRHVYELLSELRNSHPDEVQDFLAERLSSAITLRRRHFKYWKRHRDKLGATAVPDETPKPDMFASHQTSDPVPDDTPGAHPIVTLPAVMQPTPSQKTGRTLLSGTEATQHYQSLDDIVDSKSVTSYAPTVKDMNGKGIELPPPPKAASGDKDFECPYCWVVCPARYDTKGVGDLQNHLANHLERFATFALPHGRADDEDGASGTASRGSCNTQALSEPIDSDESNASLALNRDLESEQSFGPDHVADPSQSLLSAETLQQLPDESNNRMAMISNQVEDPDDSEDEQPDDGQLDDNILPEHQKHLEEREAFRQHVSSLPGVLSVRFYRGYGSWTGLITFADDLVGEAATTLFDTERFPDVQFQSKNNKSKWKFTRVTGTDRKNSFNRQPTADTQTTEEADILPSGSETYDEEDEASSKQAIITTAEIPTLRSLYQSRRLLQRDQSFAPNDTYNQMISFCHYDLTRLQVDAIVNNASANFQADPDPDSLHHAIYKAGGSGLREEAKSKPKVKVGQVELTHGHKLPSSWVIHAAAPGYTGRKGVGQFNVLSECYRSAMKMAANHEFKTIAFPCLGTGGCMFPARVAARIALQEMREYLDSHPRHRPERIIFCVRAAIDEKAYTDFLPVFFPPTHGDLDRARTSDWSANRAALAAQVLEARTQLQNALTAITVTYDFGTQSTVCAHDMRRIDSTLSSIRKYLLGSKELKRSLGDLNLLCSVIFTACADILDMAEQARKQGPAGNAQSIWTEANTDIRAKHGFELTSVFDYSWIFANSLEEVLILGKAEPDAMGRARHILETYGVKQKGQDAEGIRDHLDEVLYVREAEQPTPKIRGLVQVHQIPPVARLYTLGQLEAKPTMAKPSNRFNHTVCLLRDDITKLEVDIVVNSTDPSFSGMGTLDRSIFKKGGDKLRSEVSTFGKCEEGDVKATAGYLLPAKHILHVVPPGVFRSDTKNILRNIYRAVLHDAVLMRATSIAIPSIGTGMRNYPRRDCASLAMEEVKRFLESAEPGNGLDKIIFVVFSSNDEFIYKSLLPVYFPPTKGNASPTILAEQPAQVEESSFSSLMLPTGLPSLTIYGQKNWRRARFGEQPVKSRAWNDDEAKTFMDFELHVGTCKVCETGLYERTHKLCEPGFHFAEAVLQRMEMSENALVWSKADGLDSGEQLEIPVERLPSSMLLLSTVAKGGLYMSENAYAQVEKPDTADLDTPVSQHPSVPKDPDNIAQATERPHVVRVEVLSPRTDTGDWFYSWVQIFRTKIEMYSGDYDPNLYGESTGHTPYASIDFTDTAIDVHRSKETTASLWRVPPGSDQGEMWHFRSSNVGDTIALIELFKRLIDIGRHNQEKKRRAEAEKTTGPEATIASESGRDVLEDPFASVNNPDAAKLDDQVQQSSGGMWSRLTGRSAAEDEEGAGSTTLDTTAPRAVIRATALDPGGTHIRFDTILHVYESKIFVEFEKDDRPDQYHNTIHLTNAILELDRSSDDDTLTYNNVACLWVEKFGERERGASKPKDAWFFRTDGKAEADALFVVLQQAVNRNSQAEKKPASTEVEQTTSPEPMKAPVTQSEDTGEAFDAADFPGENQSLGEVKDQMDDVRYFSMDQKIRDASLDTRILAYLDNDFKTRPSSYIGQKFENIATEFGLYYRRLIAYTLQCLATEGKVHNTVDSETWVISQPGTEFPLSNREDQTKSLSSTDTDVLAGLVLGNIKNAGGRQLFLALMDQLQTNTDVLWPALRGLAADGFIYSEGSGRVWYLTDLGRKSLLELQKRFDEAEPEIGQDTGSSPHVGTSPISQQLAMESLESTKQHPSDESNTIMEELFELFNAESHLENDSNHDEDASNSLSHRALTYLRSLHGVSENISDLATTLDTQRSELQPVLRQLESDGLVKNAEDKSTWSATLLPRPGSGYMQYPCPNWQRKSHPSNYDFVDRMDILCAHCIQNPKWEDASVETAAPDDNTSTTHVRPTGSGSSIMDAAIERGEIVISTGTSWHGLGEFITRTRTTIKTSLVDERVLTEAGFISDPTHPGEYFLERGAQRGARPEEVEEWVKQTKELRAKDSQVPTHTLTESENLVVHDTSPQSTPMLEPADVFTDDWLASLSQTDASKLTITDAEIESNTKKVRVPYETPEKPGRIRIRQRLVDARVLEEEGEAFEISGDSLFLPRVPRRREIRVWAEKTRGLRTGQGEMTSEREPAPHPRPPSYDPSRMSQAGRWRDRVAIVTQAAKSRQVPAEDVEEGSENGASTSSALKRFKMRQDELLNSWPRRGLAEDVEEGSENRAGMPSTGKRVRNEKYNRLNSGRKTSGKAPLKSELSDEQEEDYEDDEGAD